MEKKNQDADKLEHTECQVLAVHPELVERVRLHTPDDDFLAGLSSFFKVFGDPTRLKILHALFDAELCVCDIAVITATTQSAVSHQLKMLRQANLVRYRREGKSVFYSLSDDHVRRIVETGIEHLRESM